MNKKFISLLLAVCLVIGLLPVMAIAADPVTTATVTLFGTEVTIDLDPNTTDTPEALYWVNGADGGLPVEAQSTDNWNYSFTIEGDDPTVTIRGANYHDKTVAFLHNEVEGLKLAYQGKENFINTEHHRIIDSTKSMSIVAIGEASLTGYGRVVISSGTLTLNGGTITITRVDSTTNSLLDFKNSTVTVDNCTLNLNDNKTGKAYPLAQGKNLNINNSTVTMQSGTYITLAGTTNAYYNGISAALKLTVDGNSDVKIINNCTTNPDGTTFIGVGIANNDPNNVVVNGGTLEVQGTQIAMNKAPKLTDYVVNSCDMFTANGKVTEYEESTYFKVAPAGTPTTTPSTSVPATSVPATSVPATSVPATSAPATSAPATSVPATSVPATSVPATSVPATSVPATSVPATSAPTTSAPTTSAPTTSAPTTSASTSAPTSATAPAWTMTAPAVTITQPTAPATPATGGMVTLFGTAETIDLDPNTTDIPEALYWVNGEEGALPVAAQSTDNWNYSFTIEDGVPTVTIRDAKYVNANAEHLFLDNTLNGLKLAYQGKNIIDSDHRSIIKSSTSMSIDAIGEASLTATGRVVMSSTGTLTLNDGTITITRLSNQTLSLLDFKKSTVTVNNCNLNLNDNKSGKAYPLAQGKTLNITNSNVTMESGSYVTLGGTMNAHFNEFSSSVLLTVDGNSFVKVINTCTTDPSTNDVVGTGIWANVTIKSGNVVVEGTNRAVYGTMNLASYNGQFNMYTEKGGPAVGQYTETPHFMIAYTDNPAPTAPTVPPTSPPIIPVPNGDIPLKTTVKIGGTTYELKKYDADVIYTINKAVDAVDENGVAFTRWIQTTEGANADNWNTKFVWDSDESAPTLYLRGFKMDHWNNDTDMFAWNASTETTDFVIAIETGSAVPMNIVLLPGLKGEDNLIEAQHGILYKNNLTILSKDNGKLTMDNAYSNVATAGAAGYTLTVDANLDLCIRTYSSSNYSGALINKGDIIINGGNIKTRSGIENRDAGGIVAGGTVGTDQAGDLIINGGNIDVGGYGTRTIRNGALVANGMLIINGGVINATQTAAVGMNGYEGIVINDGVVNVMAPWRGITAGYEYKNDKGVWTNKGMPISINGGTVTVMSERCFVFSEVTIGEGVMVYGGAGQKYAEVYDGKNTALFAKPWFFSTDDESKFLDIEEEEEDDDSILDAPTAPTTADGTAAPTDATGGVIDPTGVVDPTGATTPEDEIPEDEIPEDEIPEDEYWDSNIFVDYVEGDMDEIPDALYELGLDSVDAIWDALLDMMWNVDEYINRVSFFDAVPWFYDGEEWIFADENHLPEDGYVTVVLPYPEGTDMDTEFTALHMFTTDTFGMTPGDVELLMPVNTEDGIELELTGLSPVMLGWIDYDVEDEINPPTGDTGVVLYIGLMVVAVLGMAGTVMLSNKKKRRA